MVKYLCMPGQVSFKIKSGSDRFSHMVKMEFGPAHGCKQEYHHGVYISRRATAQIIKGIRKGIRQK